MRKVWANIALLMGTVIVGLIVAEVLLRMLGIGYPLFTQADQWTGFALRPNASGWQTEEGRAWVKMNSHGMRDREFTERKPAQTLRIAVLGDSFAEGRQVEEEQTFPSIMEQELKSCKNLDGKDVEVLNFGVSGYGTGQEFLQMHTRVWRFAPDIVLLAFTTGNDIRNNSRSLESGKDKPYFRVENGALVADMSFRNDPAFIKQWTYVSRVTQWAVNHSRVLQLLNRSRKIFTAHAQVAGSEAGLDMEIYRESPSPQWEEAWTITESILKAMHEESAANDAKFMVATLSNGIQVHPDREVREQFKKSLGVADLFAPDRRVGMMGVRTGYPVFMLAGSLLKDAEKEDVYLHGFDNTTMGEGHWNAEGHERAGKFLSSILCKGKFLE